MTEQERRDAEDNVADARLFFDRSFATIRERQSQLTATEAEAIKKDFIAGFGHLTDALDAYAAAEKRPPQEPTEGGHGSPGN